jgi:hypothetical protein
MRSEHMMGALDQQGTQVTLTNEVFGFYNGSTIYPVQREYYKPTTSFGVRWSIQGEQ